MKKSIIFLLLLVSVGVAVAQSPKREMRAVWLTTAWQLDWPFTHVPVSNGTNDEVRKIAIADQKNSLVTIFDQLQSTNMNAVFFQVRSMCDALYDSAFEPWSQYVSSARGSDPGWDPLQFAIEEAHKRGMELHAWLNPYRYSTAAESHGNLPTDYANTHPEWLITSSADTVTKILNPGIPEVTQRICDVVEDIITKYNVDGIVFDDYFYINNRTSNAADQAQFDAYNPKGLSRADWRRANVNSMIKAVYDRIQTIKPYVAFGLSPAGLAKGGCAAVGVAPPPVTGSDWQYNGIYADPMAWLNEGSIDYISPQIYWSHTSSGNPYGPLSKWWSEVSKKFGRHFYASQSFSIGTQEEMGRQIDSNRTYDVSDAPGSVFFRTGQFTPSVVRDYLKTNQFRMKALPPAIDWKTHPAYDDIGEVNLTGFSLGWDPVSGVPGGARYSIYAVPISLTGTDPVDYCTTSQHLLGISYTNGYTVPLAYAQGHDFVVGLLDRYGNEFLTGKTDLIDPNVLSIPKIFTPENLSIAGNPLAIQWYPVPAASGFTVERSTSSDFTGATTITVGAGIYQTTFTDLTDNTTYYVQIRADNGASSPSGWSDPVQFLAMTIPDIPEITSPVNGSLVPRFATISWTTDPRATRGYTIQWSTNADFSGSPSSANINAADTDNYTYGATTLQVGETYYVRIRARYDESSNTDWSETMQIRVYNPAIERLLTLGTLSGAPYGDLLTIPYSIEVGETVYLGIRTGSNAGNSSDWDSRLSYDLSSNDPSVAFINDVGTVTGVSLGTTIIKAVGKSGNRLEGSIILTVTGEEPPLLTLSLGKTSIAIEETAELTITDEYGEPVDNQDCNFFLTDTDPTQFGRAKVTVTENGEVTGLRLGTTTILAVRQSDNAAGTIEITVENFNNITVPGTDAVIAYGTENGAIVRFDGIADIELYSITGLLIDKTKASQTYSRSLGKGIYIAVVHHEGQIFRNKLIVK